MDDKQKIFNIGHRMWLFKIGLRETHKIIWFAQHGVKFNLDD